MNYNLNSPLKNDNFETKIDLYNLDKRMLDNENNNKRYLCTKFPSYSDKGELNAGQINNETLNKVFTFSHPNSSFDSEDNIFEDNNNYNNNKKIENTNFVPDNHKMELLNDLFHKSIFHYNKNDKFIDLEGDKTNIKPNIFKIEEYKKGRKFKKQKLNEDEHQLTLKFDKEKSTLKKKIHTKFDKENMKKVIHNKFRKFLQNFMNELIIKYDSDLISNPTKDIFKKRNQKKSKLLLSFKYSQSVNNIKEGKLFLNDTIEHYFSTGIISNKCKSKNINHNKMVIDKIKHNKLIDYFLNMKIKYFYLNFFAPNTANYDKYYQDVIDVINKCKFPDLNNIIKNLAENDISDIDGELYSHKFERIAKYEYINIYFPNEKI